MIHGLPLATNSARPATVMRIGVHQQRRTGRGALQTGLPVFASSASMADRPSAGSRPRSNWTMTLSL